MATSKHGGVWPRRTLLAAAGLTIVTSGSARASGRRPFVVPADGVRHRRTWMAWPDSSAIWGHRLAGVQMDIATVARTIAKYEPVVLCANKASVAQARAACGPTVTVIGSIPVDDCWIRDMGAVFRLNGRGGLDAIGTNFNGWGHKQRHAHDAEVARRIAAHVGVRFHAADFVGEGGAIETDGRGTLMATASSLVNSNRNPGKTRGEIALAMCRAYGASKVIWFPGIRGHDITDDHVDATSRFTGRADGLVQVPPPSENDRWARDARQQERLLAKASDAHGRAIVVERLRGPHYARIRSRNRDFVASYANYYLCNGAVIAAQFGDQSADAAAKATLARIFPGRVIETLNIDHLGAGGGGIHCVTQPQPRR